MQLFRAKVWSVVDIGFLKWSCLLFGMIAGSYCADFVRKHVVGLALAALGLAVKPTVSYFSDEK